MDTNIEIKHFVYVPTSHCVIATAKDKERNCIKIYLVLTGENYLKVGSHYAFQNNPNCKSFLPKMTSPDVLIGLTRNILGLQ